MRISPVKIVSFLLLLAGALSGPGYWVYAKFYTGSQAALLNLAQTESQEHTPVWRTPEFALSQDMAPLGLILVAKGNLDASQETGRPPTDHYAATLFKNGQAADPLAFTLRIKNNSVEAKPIFREHLVLFQVIQDGRYQLEVEASTPPAIPLEQMQLEVRQHLLEPDSRVVTGGLLMFTLGILGLVLI